MASYSFYTISYGNGIYYLFMYIYNVFSILKSSLMPQAIVFSLLLMLQQYFQLYNFLFSMSYWKYCYTVGIHRWIVCKRVSCFSCIEQQNSTVQKYSVDISVCFAPQKWPLIYFHASLPSSKSHSSKLHKRAKFHEITFNKIQQNYKNPPLSFYAQKNLCQKKLA